MKAALWLVNSEKGMYVGLKQPRQGGEHCVTSARAAAKETRRSPVTAKNKLFENIWGEYKQLI